MQWINRQRERERERERERKMYVEPCRENYLLGVHFFLETDRMIGVTSLLVDVAFDGFLSDGIHIRLFFDRAVDLPLDVHIAATVKEHIIAGRLWSI